MLIPQPPEFTTTLLDCASDPFRLLVESVKDYAIYLLDPEGRIASWNTGAERIKGYTAAEVLGHPFAMLFSAEAVAAGKPQAILNAALANGKYEEESERCRKGGGKFWAICTITALNERGQHVGFAVIVRDISERKRQEDLLRESEERFRLMFEGVKDYAIFLIDTEGVVKTWNAGAARLYGYSAEEIIGQQRHRFFTAEDIAAGLPERELQEAASGGFSEEAWRVRKDGSRFWANGSLSALRRMDGSLLGFVKVVRNLTERKLAEEQLRVSEDRFRTLINALSHIVWTWDPKAEHAVSTPSWAEFTGLSEEDAAGWGWVKAVHPEDRDRAAKQWQRSLETLEPYELDYRVHRADGQWRYFTVRGVPLFHTDGTVREWVGICIDDTERRQVEEDLLLRDRALQEVSSSIVITDQHLPDNPIIYVNPAFERITGYSPAEALGKNCRFLQGKDTDRAVIAQLRAAIAVGRSCDVEVLNYRKNGTPFWNQLSISPVHDSSGRLTHFIGVQIDITERKKLEMQFRQAQKMEAIGRLAGGVAHDFNNMLTIINGYTDILVGQFPTGDLRQEMMAEVHKAGERAGMLTKQLLVFSRQSMLEPKVFDLNNVVADTEKMLSRLIGEDVRLTTVPAPGLPPIKADPSQLQQALINLCVNARDAMPQGGILTIETQDVELTEEQCRLIPDLKPGRYSMLAVTDTGTGMAPSTLSQMFEPFFTTKETGHGTGLGLAMVYGFVKSSGGHISVYSELGIGTSFKLYFPQVQEGVSSRKSSPNAEHTPRGTETVLLVEDDDAVRALTRYILQVSGYTVLAASNGREAVRFVTEHPGPIHLLLTDVVMPYMGGREVAERVTAINPQIKVLYCSGYTDDAVVRHGIVEAGMAFVQKPYSPSMLTQKVREVLDGKA